MSSSPDGWGMLNTPYKASALFILFLMNQDTRSARDRTYSFVMKT
jgi:hypothetical protein